MAIADELQRLIDAKADIKASIENKGVTVGDSTLDTYASKIDEITTGGGSVEGHKVTFWDFDGVILKEEIVQDGEDATPPITPNHPYLVFDGWNRDYVNITKDTDIGAIYDTDNKGVYFETRGNVTTYGFRLEAPDLTIDWGDGSPLLVLGETTSSVAHTHTYDDNNSYMINIRSSGEFTIVTYTGGYGYQSNFKNVYIGSSLSANQYRSEFPKGSFGNKLSLPNKIFNNYSFSGSNNLKHINLPYGGITTSADSLFSNCYFLKNIIGDVGISNGNTFSGCNSLKKVSYYNISNNFTNNNFYECYNFPFNDGTVTVPNNINSLGVNVFVDCFNITNFIFQPSTPPTITSESLHNNMGGYKLPHFLIFVPDESVDAYKTATNWTEYSDYIYPVSMKGELI